ncbi:60S ribosomal protein L38 [Lambiella insularis]|nr:60S ribosomal protein L38 [Lambiella insularis]
MPREVSDIKQFIEYSRRKDASFARIKRSRKTGQIKFKLRCTRHLYTLVLKDSDKADKLKQSLPPKLVINDTPKKNKKGKRVA